MNILNAMFRTASRVASCGDLSPSYRDIGQYVKAMKVAKTDEQREEIRRAMLVRLDGPHF